MKKPAKKKPAVQPVYGWAPVVDGEIVLSGVRYVKKYALLHAHFFTPPASVRRVVVKLAPEKKHG